MKILSSLPWNYRRFSIVFNMIGLLDRFSFSVKTWTKPVTVAFPFFFISEVVRPSYTFEMNNYKNYECTHFVELRNGGEKKSVSLFGLCERYVINFRHVLRTHSSVKIQNTVKTFQFIWV